MSNSTLGIPCIEEDYANFQTEINTDVQGMYKWDVLYDPTSKIFKNAIAPFPEGEHRISHGARSVGSDGGLIYNKPFPFVVPIREKDSAGNWQAGDYKRGIPNSETPNLKPEIFIGEGRTYTFTNIYIINDDYPNIPTDADTGQPNPDYDPGKPSPGPGAWSEFRIGSAPGVELTAADGYVRTGGEQSDGTYSKGSITWSLPVTDENETKTYYYYDPRRLSRSGEIIVHSAVSKADPIGPGYWDDIEKFFVEDESDLPYMWDSYDEDGDRYTTAATSDGLKPNLILDSGLDKLAEMSYAQVAQFAVGGTGAVGENGVNVTRPTKETGLPVCPGSYDVDGMPNTYPPNPPGTQTLAGCAHSEVMVIDLVHMRTDPDPLPAGWVDPHALGVDPKLWRALTSLGSDFATQIPLSAHAPLQYDCMIVLKDFRELTKDDEGALLYWRGNGTDATPGNIDHVPLYDLESYKEDLTAAEQSYKQVRIKSVNTFYERRDTTDFEGHSYQFLEGEIEHVNYTPALTGTPMPDIGRSWGNSNPQGTTRDNITYYGDDIQWFQTELHHIQQTDLQRPYKLSQFYVPGRDDADSTVQESSESIFCGTRVKYEDNDKSRNIKVVEFIRTYDFYMELTPVTYREIGFKESPAASTLFSRIVLDQEVHLRAGQFLRVSYHLFVNQELSSDLDDEVNSEALDPDPDTGNSWVLPSEWGGSVINIPATGWWNNQIITDDEDTRKLCGREKLQRLGIAGVSDSGVAEPWDESGLCNEVFAVGTIHNGPGYGYTNRWMNGTLTEMHPPDPTVSLAVLSPFDQLYVGDDENYAQDFTVEPSDIGMDNYTVDIDNNVRLTNRQLLYGDNDDVQHKVGDAIAYHTRPSGHSANVNSGSGNFIYRLFDINGVPITSATSNAIAIIPTVTNYTITFDFASPTADLNQQILFVMTSLNVTLSGNYNEDKIAWIHPSYTHVLSGTGDMFPFEHGGYTYHYTHTGRNPTTTEISSVLSAVGPTPVTSTTTSQAPNGAISPGHMGIIIDETTVTNIIDADAYYSSTGGSGGSTGPVSNPEWELVRSNRSATYPFYYKKTDTQEIFIGDESAPSEILSHTPIYPARFAQCWARGIGGLNCRTPYGQNMHPNYAQPPYDFRPLLKGSAYMGNGIREHTGRDRVVYSVYDWQYYTLQAPVGLNDFSWYTGTIAPSGVWTVTQQPWQGGHAGVGVPFDLDVPAGLPQWYWNQWAEAYAEYWNIYDKGWVETTYSQIQPPTVTTPSNYSSWWIGGLSQQAQFSGNQNDWGVLPSGMQNIVDSYYRSFKTWKGEINLSELKLFAANGQEVSSGGGGVNTVGASWTGVGKGFYDLLSPAISVHLVRSKIPNPDYVRNGLNRNKDGFRYPAGNRYDQTHANNPFMFGPRNWYDLKFGTDDSTGTITITGVSGGNKTGLIEFPTFDEAFIDAPDDPTTNKPYEYDISSLLEFTINVNPDGSINIENTLLDPQLYTPNLAGDAGLPDLTLHPGDKLLLKITSMQPSGRISNGGPVFEYHMPHDNPHILGGNVFNPPYLTPVYQSQSTFNYLPRTQGNINNRFDNTMEQYRGEFNSVKAWGSEVTLFYTPNETFGEGICGGAPGGGGQPIYLKPCIKKITDGTLEQRSALMEPVIRYDPLGESCAALWDPVAADPLFVPQPANFNYLYQSNTETQSWVIDKTSTTGSPLWPSYTDSSASTTIPVHISLDADDDSIMHIWTKVEDPEFHLSNDVFPTLPFPINQNLSNIHNPLQQDEYQYDSIIKYEVVLSNCVGCNPLDHTVTPGTPTTNTFELIAATRNHLTVKTDSMFSSSLDQGVGPGGYGTGKIEQHYKNSEYWFDPSADSGNGALTTNPNWDSALPHGESEFTRGQQSSLYTGAPTAGAGWQDINITIQRVVDSRPDYKMNTSNIVYWPNWLYPDENNVFFTNHPNNNLSGMPPCTRLKGSPVPGASAFISNVGPLSGKPALLEARYLHLLPNPNDNIIEPEEFTRWKWYGRTITLSPEDISENIDYVAHFYDGNDKRLEYVSGGSANPGDAPIVVMHGPLPGTDPAMLDGNQVPLDGWMVFADTIEWSHHNNKLRGKQSLKLVAWQDGNINGYVSSGPLIGQPLIPVTGWIYPFSNGPLTFDIGTNDEGIADAAGDFWKKRRLQPSGKSTDRSGREFPLNSQTALAEWSVSTDGLGDWLTERPYLSGASFECPLIKSIYKPGTDTLTKFAQFESNFANRNDWCVIGIGPTSSDPMQWPQNMKSAARWPGYVFMFAPAQRKLDTHVLRTYFKYTWDRDMTL
jgi:hypothetical protein